MMEREPARRSSLLDQRLISPRSKEQSYFIQKEGELDDIDIYYSEIGQKELLTRDQEASLSKRIEQGREAMDRLVSEPIVGVEREQIEKNILDGQQAFQTLVESNTRLVIAMAKRYQNQGVAFLDLIQEGNIGLMAAANKFDWRRGLKFSTCAIWWIRQSVTRALANQGRTIRLPVHMNDRSRKIYAVSTELEKHLGRRPTEFEIADHVESMSPKQIKSILDYSRPVYSFELPVKRYEGKELKLGDTLEDEFDESQVVNSILSGDITELMLCLTAREQRVIELRFGLRNGHAHSLREIGKLFGLTAERIRQIENEAFIKLRNPKRSEKFRSYLQD